MSNFSSSCGGKQANAFAITFPYIRFIGPCQITYTRHYSYSISTS
jgi:hypothetical protein